MYELFLFVVFIAIVCHFIMKGREVMDTDTMLEDDRVEKLRWEALVACIALWEAMDIDNVTYQRYMITLSNLLEGE